MHTQLAGVSAAGLHAEVTHLYYMLAASDDCVNHQQIQRHWLL